VPLSQKAIRLPSVLCVILKGREAVRRREIKKVLEKHFLKLHSQQFEKMNEFVLPNDVLLFLNFSKFAKSHCTENT